MPLTPTVDDVALLLRTRTISGTSTGLGGDTGAAEITTFTEDTRPNEDEVRRLIQMAEDTILGRYGGEEEVPPAAEGQVRLGIAVYAARLIELSFFREQYDREVWDELLADALEGTEAEVDEGTSLKTFGTLVIGSTRSSAGLSSADYVAGIDDAEEGVHYLES
jgi:hypothetical protein